jgi:hypothetical protein
VPTEPIHLAEELIPLWEAYVSRQAEIDEDIDVAEFLRSVDFDVTPFAAPVLMRASGLIRPPSIAG